MYTRYASGQEGGRKRSWTLTPLGGASVQGLGGSAPDRGQDAVPEAGAGGGRDVHGLRTLAPLGVVVTAQVGEHLHGHPRVVPPLPPPCAGPKIGQKRLPPPPLPCPRHPLAEIPG